MKDCYALALSLLALPAAAQPVAVLTPARNALNVPRATRIQAQLSQPPALGARLRVFSRERGGQRPGSTQVTGNTLVMTPSQEFRAGETVAVTLQPSVSGSAPIAGAQTYQFTVAATGGTANFGSPATVPTSGQAVALADLDGDGDLDMVVTNMFTPYISRFENDGRGVFLQAATLPFTSPLVDVVPADVNGDGAIDLVVATVNGAEVSLNNGQGIFATKTSYNLRFILPSALAMADVDADGDLDMLVGSSQTGAVYVRRNVGNGVFAAATTVNLATDIKTLVAADVDNDGDMDLVVAGYNVTFALNDGSGTFQRSTPLTVGGDATGIALGDVDGDGDLDLLVSYTNRNEVSIRLNQGNGTYDSGTQLPLSGTCQSMALADVDGDGDLDLLAAIMTGNSVSVRLNNGAGSFNSSPTALPNPTVGGGPRRIVSADLDGDGDMDIATVAGAVSLLFNNGHNAPLGTASARPAGLALSPNPAHATATVQLPVGLGTATLTLTDALGRAVRRQALSAASGAAEISLVGLTPGLYHCLVQAAGQKWSQRLVVE